MRTHTENRETRLLLPALQGCTERQVKNGLEIVSLWLTPEDRMRWKRSANKACLTLSEWIRRRCNGQKIVEPVRWRQQKNA